jgi:hypothetical protein
MSSTKTSATPQATEFLVELLADPDAVIRADEKTWMQMAREATYQGVLPLFHARIRRLQPGTVPTAVATAVTDRYARAAIWSSLIFRELDLISSTLAARDIPVLILKGLHLAADVYDDRALRTMGDLDIMVPRERLGDACRALADAGFDVPAVDNLDEYCQTNSHLPRMTPPGGRGLGLEVHWTIELPTNPFDISPAELWAGARPLDVNGRAVLVLSPEHLLLHLCLHACYHHRFSHTPLKQLCDIAVVLRRYQGEMDWELLAGTAERWGIQSFVRFTIMLACEVMGSQVPDTIRSLPAVQDEERLLESARAYILNCTMAMPTALTSAIRSRSWTRRLRTTARHIFPPPGRMAAIYDLPHPSPRVFVMYLVRPFDLLVRKGRLTLELVLPGRAGQRMRSTEQHRFLLKTALSSWTQAAGRTSGGG